MNRSLFAQDDTTRIKKRPGLRRFFTGYTAPDEDYRPKTDRILFDLYWNSWFGDLNNTQTKWYSVGFNISFMTDITFSKKSPVGLGIGLGFSHYNIHTNGNLSPDTLDNGTGFTKLKKLQESSDREFNKFVANYIEVPFEVRLRLGEDTKFKFSPGFKVGFQTNSFNKYRLANGNKFKDLNFPDNNRLRYGATARIGVGIFMLYGSYFFSDMFQESSSSRLNPFTLGLSISLF